MGADNTLKVDPEAMQRAAAALSGGAKDLQNRLAELDAQVGEMLGGWRGASGGAYASVWELWRRGAREVQLGLSRLATSVGEAAESYQQNEAAAARALRGVWNG
jgi:WXG100 family type VII secretion target